MKVILLTDVKGVGRRFEEKEVSNGYALNFLIPQKLAVPSGSGAATQAIQERDREAAAHSKTLTQLQNRVAELAGTTVEVRLPANDQGHLFEKLTAGKLSEILKLDARLIELEKPIKEIGIFEVPIAAGEGKHTSVKLEVSREN